MRITKSRIMLLAGLAVISVIFLLLRLKTLGHLLMWDEARDILSLRAFLNNDKSDMFYLSYYFHPPLYLWFAKFLAPFGSGFDLRFEYLSLLFSYITLVVTYYFSARLGGWRYALACGASLALMPVSMAYDTWIKSDCLASALGYFAIFLLFRRNYMASAVFLGLTLLAKESAIFFIFSATLILLYLRHGNALKILSRMYLIILAMTFWWFAWFSTFIRVSPGIFFSKSGEASHWDNGVLYYFKRLQPDLGGAILALFVIGICYLAYLVCVGKQRRWSFPLALFACVYIPNSFLIVSKVPWQCLAARPALAMIAGAGVVYLFKMARTANILAAIPHLLLILAMIAGISFSYEDYHRDATPYGWAGAGASRKIASYLNGRIRDGERVMITSFAYWRMPLCPIFLFYWKGAPVQLIKGDETPQDVLRDIAANRISWLIVADSPSTNYNFKPIVKALSSSVLGRPDIVGMSYVWRTGALWGSGSDK